MSFAIEDEEAIEKLERDKDKVLVLETKRHSDKRSLNANAYFWVLCDKIAHKLNTTKDHVYLMQLASWGVWFDVQVSVEDLPSLKKQFRYVEEKREPFSDITVARCYLGSSTYDKEQMAYLIDGTVRDAKELQIDTWTPDEIARVLEDWEVQQ